MKLHELDIADAGPGAPRHRHAIPRGNIRIGGFFEHPAQPARGQQHRPRPHRAQLRAIECHGPHALRTRHQQIGNGRIALKADIGQ